MAASCQLCSKKPGTAAIVIVEGKRSYDFWSCYPCRLAVDISHRTGVQSKASRQLDKLLQAKQAGQIVPIDRR